MEEFETRPSVPWRIFYSGIFVASKKTFRHPDFQFCKCLQRIQNEHMQRLKQLRVEKTLTSPMESVTKNSIRLPRTLVTDVFQIIQINNERRKKNEKR
jgi:hypothetical protein